MAKIPSRKNIPRRMEQIACPVKRGKAQGRKIGRKSMNFCKGQLISECPFGVFKSTKKPTNFL